MEGWWSTVWICFLTRSVIGLLSYPFPRWSDKVRFAHAWIGSPSTSWPSVRWSFVLIFGAINCISWLTLRVFFLKLMHLPMVEILVPCLKEGFVPGVHSWEPIWDSLTLNFVTVDNAALPHKLDWKLQLDDFHDRCWRAWCSIYYWPS